MFIFVWISLGLTVGIGAKFLMPRLDPGSVFIMAHLGVVGGLVGGFLGRLIGWYGDGDPVGFAMAAIGAIVLVGAYRLSTERSDSS